MLLLHSGQEYYRKHSIVTTLKDHVQGISATYTLAFLNNSEIFQSSDSEHCKFQYMRIAIGCKINRKSIEDQHLKIIISIHSQTL